MNLIKTAFLIFALQAPFFTNAQIKVLSLPEAKEELNAWGMLKYDFKSILGGVGHSISAPVRWDGQDFLTAGGVLAGTALILIADQSARDYFVAQEPDAPQVIKEIGWYFGSPQNFYLATGAFYGVGLITKSSKIRKTAVLIIASSATAGFIQSLAKTVVGRARPDEVTGPLTFSPFSNKARYHSFPSGHTVLSVSMAHAIAKQFDNIWVKTGIYTLGAIAPVSRLWNDAHWLTDIVLGTALSIAVVDSVDNYLNKKERYLGGNRTPKISWRFSAGFGSIGLVGTF